MATSTVLAGCRIVPGIHTNGGEQARAYLYAGFKMVILSSDAALLRAAHRSELARVRSGSGAGPSERAARGPYA